MSFQNPLTKKLYNLGQITNRHFTQDLDNVPVKPSGECYTRRDWLLQKKRCVLHYAGWGGDQQLHSLLLTIPGTNSAGKWLFVGNDPFSCMCRHQLLPDRYPFFAPIRDKMPTAIPVIPSARKSVRAVVLNYFCLINAAPTAATPAP
jgi:hypothetical protein